jgi:hypothetical protein
MSDLRKTISKFVWTKGEWQWSESLQRYTLLRREGYEYEGPWALAHNVAPTWEAEDFQFFNDNGSITTATSIAAQNTAVVKGDNIATGTIVQLKVNVGETAGAAGSGQHSGGWTLQFNVNGGSYSTVGAATTVKYADSANLTNGTAIAGADYALTWGSAGVQRDWGDECEDGVSLSGNVWSSDYCEICFVVQLDAVEDDVVRFRMLAPDGTTAVTFSNVPTITIGVQTSVINTKVLQDLDSVAVADPTDDFERLRNRLNADAFDVDYSYDTIRKRELEVYNNLFGIIDNAIATYVVGPDYAIYNKTLQDLDSIAATDLNDLLRLRDRFALSTLTADDVAEVLRLRSRTDLSEITANDVVVAIASRLRESLSTITADDLVDVLRLRERLNLSTITAEDEAFATYVPDQTGIINNELLQDLDSAALSDLVEILRLRDRQALSTIVVSDFLGDLSRLRFRILQDAAALVDSQIPVRDRNRILADVIDFVDNEVYFKLADRLIADSAVVTDDSLFYAARSKVLVGNIISLTDTLSKIRISPWSLIDVIDTSDAAIMARLRQRLTSDAVEILDNVIATYTAPGSITYNRTLSDSLTVADLLNVLRLREQLLSDSTTIVDGLVSVAIRNRGLADQLDISDLLARYLAQRKAVGDTLAMSDSVIVSTVYDTLIDFFVRHNVEQLNVDQDVKRFHIRTNVSRDT